MPTYPAPLIASTAQSAIQSIPAPAHGFTALLDNGSGSFTFPIPAYYDHDDNSKIKTAFLAAGGEEAKTLFIIDIPDANNLVIVEDEQELDLPNGFNNGFYWLGKTPGVYEQIPPDDVDCLEQPLIQVIGDRVKLLNIFIRNSAVTSDIKSEIYQGTDFSGVDPNVHAIAVIAGNANPAINGVYYFDNGSWLTSSPP